MQQPTPANITFFAIGIWVAIFALSGIVSVVYKFVECRRHILHRWDLPDGKLKTQAFLGDRRGREVDLEVLSVFGGQVWLWNDRLETRNLDTLEVQDVSAKILEANPEWVAVFPNAAEFFRVSARFNTLLLRSLDAR